MRRPTSTATGRLRSFAATTAASEAATSRMKLVGVDPVDRCGQHAHEPGEERAHRPDTERDRRRVRSRQVRHGRRVDHRPDLQPHLGVAQHHGAEHHRQHDADVHGDLVLVDRHAQELVDRIGVGREPRRLRDGAVPEDPGRIRQGGDGHEEAERRHHLDQGRRQPEEAEQHAGTARRPWRARPPGPRRPRPAQCPSSAWCGGNRRRRAMKYAIAPNAKFKMPDEVYVITRPAAAMA